MCQKLKGSQCRQGSMNVEDQLNISKYTAGGGEI